MFLSSDHSDEAVSHSIRLGVELSRAEVLYYHHNGTHTLCIFSTRNIQNETKGGSFFFFFFLLIDMKHLEEVLQKVKEEDARGKRKLTRRFIIFEGLSFNSGGTKKKTKKKKTFWNLTCFYFLLLLLYKKLHLWSKLWSLRKSTASVSWWMTRTPSGFSEVKKKKKNTFTFLHVR